VHISDRASIREREGPAGVAVLDLFLLGESRDGPTTDILSDLVCAQLEYSSRELSTASAGSARIINERFGNIQDQESKSTS